MWRRGGVDVDANKATSVRSGQLSDASGDDGINKETGTREVNNKASTLAYVSRHLIGGG